MKKVKYPLYPAYKNSNVEWLEEIPESWSFSKLKYLADIKTGSKDTVDQIEDGEFPFFVRSQTIERINTCTMDCEAILTAGDGVGVGKVFHYINGKFDYHQRVYGITNFKDITGKFFFYYMQENLKKEIVKHNAKSTVDSLRLPMFQNFPVAFPSLAEQKEIATFLDQKTSQIDSLIEKKKRFIELLKEERSAVINHAVTKGLDPNAKMKDSGVEWIGEIPEGWAIKPLGYIGSCQNGISAGGEYFGSGNPFVNYGDVYNNIEVNASGLAQSTQVDQDRYSVQEGDTFFTRTSETKTEIAIASTCISTIGNSVFSGFLIRFRPKKKLLYSGFSKFYFRSNLHLIYFVKEMNLVTRASLSQDLLKKLTVLIPPLTEQKQIAAFLNQKTSQIDSTISNNKKEMNLMQEYRSALISEAVTGKIDVRGRV